MAWRVDMTGLALFILCFISTFLGSAAIPLCTDSSGCSYCIRFFCFLFFSSFGDVRTFACGLFCWLLMASLGQGPLYHRRRLCPSVRTTEVSAVMQKRTLPSRSNLSRWMCRIRLAPLSSNRFSALLVAILYWNAVLDLLSCQWNDPPLFLFLSLQFRSLLFSFLAMRNT